MTTRGETPELCFRPQVTRTRPKSRADALLVPRPEHPTTGSALCLPCLPLPSALLRAQVHPDQQPGNPRHAARPHLSVEPPCLPKLLLLPWLVFSGICLCPSPFPPEISGPQRTAPSAPPEQKEAGKERRQTRESWDRRFEVFLARNPGENLQGATGLHPSRPPPSFTRPPTFESFVHTAPLPLTPKCEPFEHKKQTCAVTRVKNPQHYGQGSSPA